jgi:phospholipase/carboxylesterase
MTQLDGPRIKAAAGQARELIVLLHGYGADGEDLIGLAPHMQTHFPGAAFVAPNAPDAIPGMGFGRQWFALDGYDPARMQRDPAFAEQTFARMAGLAARASVALNQFIDAELARHNLTPDRLALVGFSQGTMMSLYAGPRRAPGPAAIVGFSGSLVGAERLAEEAKSRPPVLLVHGDADPVVPVERLLHAAGGLGAAGFLVQWQIIPGLEHSIDPDGLDRAVRFLRDAFTGRL